MLNQHWSAPTAAPFGQVPPCGLPTRSARSALPDPTFGIELEATTLKSVPEAKLAIPLTCQPPMRASTERRPDMNLLPLPNGRSEERRVGKSLHLGRGRKMLDRKVHTFGLTHAATG